MKRFLCTGTALLTLVAATLLTPAIALAAGTTTNPAYVPSGQSAASQYTEDVPTAGGNVSTGKVHHSAATVGGGSGGSGGGSSSGSGGSGSGGSGGASAISPSTVHSMSKAGSAGAAAASVATALAPTRHAQLSPEAGAVANPSSPASQVVKTLGGSDAGGGIGVLLPIILIGSLILASGFGLARFFRPGAPS